MELVLPALLVVVVGSPWILSPAAVCAVEDDGGEEAEDWSIVEVLEVDGLLSSATLHLPEPLCDGCIVGFSSEEDTSSCCKMEEDEGEEDCRTSAEEHCLFATSTSRDGDEFFEMAVRALVEW